MLELYHHGTSACAAKVRFALAEKRLHWSGRYVDILAGEQFSPRVSVDQSQGSRPRFDSRRPDHSRIDRNL